MLGPDIESTESACVVADALATVSGGVGVFVDPAVVACLGVDVASVVSAPYHGMSLTG